MSFLKTLFVFGLPIFSYNAIYAWPWDLNLSGKYKIDTDCYIKKEIYKQNEHASRKIGELIDESVDKNSPFISLPVFYRDPDFPIDLLKLDREFEIKMINKDHISLKYDYFGWSYPHNFDYLTTIRYPLVVTTWSNTFALHMKYIVAPLPGESLQHKYGYLSFTKISSDLIRLEYEFTIPSKQYHRGLEYLELDWTNGIYVRENASCYLKKL